MDVVFVHGYNVTSTRTYGVLPQRLRDAGHTVKHVYLAKYVTLDDDIRPTDLIRALQTAFEDVFGAPLGDREFSCITHSTGALIVRAWIDAYHADRMSRCPIVHLIMLAPPTNGSRLAELGKSRLSRLRNLVGREPGLKVLDALELGSRFQWELNSAWIERPFPKAPRFYPVVICGQWIDKRLWDVIAPATYERGSDGVVRAAAANLNMKKILFDADGGVTMKELKDVPFLVAPRTSHSDTRFGIMGSVPAKGGHAVLAGILRALDVDSKRDYARLGARFAEQTARLQQTEPYYDGSKLNRYCQLVFRITDQLGNAVNDYAIELIDGTGRGDRLPAGFMADKHQNEVSPQFFVFYLDYDRIAAVQGGKLGFRVQSATNTPLVAYAEREFFAGADVRSVVRPNETVFLDVVLRRRISKNVFRFTRNLSPEKIPTEPGEEWIE